MRLLLTASLAALAGAFLAAPAAAQQIWSGEGQLEDSDSEDADNFRYDEHVLQLEAGRRYRISAESEAFDTYIRLFRAGESEPVAENDDFEGLNSRISYQPQESGEYRLRVLSYSPDGRGAYTASAEAMPPLPPPVSARPSATSRTRWQIWNGELSEADPDRDGHRFDDYPIRMRAGQTRLISVESESFDAMVWIMRAAEREGEPIDADDDAGPGYNALLAFQPEDDGDYLVRVTSYGPDETGGYRVRISDPLTPPPPLPPADLDLDVDADPDPDPDSDPDHDHDGAAH